MTEMNYIPEEYNRVCAVIHLDHVLYNLDRMHEKLPDNTKMFAVIKTDGYGHGAGEIARVLEQKEYVFGYAVATAEEAFSLRKKGILKEILVLGYTFPYAYEKMIAENITATVFRADSLQEMNRCAKKLGKKMKVHIKVDTGMGRIGIRPGEEATAFLGQLSEMDKLEVNGIFTHFSRADEKDKGFAKEQLALFTQTVNDAEKILGRRIPYKHCANSAAIIEMPETYMDLVRAGISLYGLYPSDEVDRTQVDLKPVLSLHSHVVHIKKASKGTPISYGGTYVTEEDRLIATIPVGYGDGFPRGLSNKGKVLIRGCQAPVLGRICMDQMMVDVTDIPDISVGDFVTLIGTDGDESITAEAIGNLCERFHYELLCDFGKRIPRVFVLNDRVVATKDYYFD